LTSVRSELLARQIAAAIYGITPQVHRFDSENSDVYRLDFGGALPDRVIKIDRGNGLDLVRTEQRIIRGLAALGLEVPPLEQIQEDLPHASVAFTIMPLLQGRRLGEIYREDPRRGARTFERIGRFIARLQDVPQERVPGSWGPEQAREQHQVWWTEQYEQFRRHPLFSPRLETAFLDARELIQRPPAYFGHRDSVQIITDGGSIFAVMDWGEAGACWRLYDLAFFIHAVEAWLGDGFAGTDWYERLLGGFLEGRTFDAQMKRELRVWETLAYLTDAMYFEQTGRSEFTQNLFAFAEETFRDRE
jgi:Ser/Thr protein kinase RdoA (MazF antagonist)